MGSLYQEQVEKDLTTDVEDQAEVDSRTAAAFRGEVPGVDEQTGREDKSKRAGVDCQYKNPNGVQLLEIADLKCFETRD